MFIPVVPFVGGVKVKNKKILYSDDVINDIDLLIYYVKNVYEESIEKRIKSIFEMNPGVEFERVQYSKRDEILYFYTNKELKNGVIEMRDDLAENVKSEFRKIIHQKRVKDTDCVSLNDLLALINLYDKKYNNIKNKYTKIFKKCIKDFEYIQDIKVVDFNYDKNLLLLNIYIPDKECISIYKDEGKYYSDPGSFVEVNRGLLFYQNYFEGAFSEFLKLKKMMLEESTEIKSVNTGFMIDLCNDGLDIYFEGEDKEKFKQHFYYYLNWYDIDFEEICSKIFVKISDCPKWSQKKLYELRQMQLEEEYKLKNKPMKRTRKK